MDYKLPSWGRGLYPTLFFVFFSLTLITAQTTEQKNTISNSYNQNQLTSLIKGFEKELQLKKNSIANKALRNQWASSRKQLDGTIVALNDLGTDGTPLYYIAHMYPSCKVTRADALYEDGLLDLGLTGKGMQVGIWDAGVARSTHQEFDSRVFVADDGDIDNHGTLVTGAVISSGVKKKAKGVAYEATANSNDWSRDKIEVTEAVADGMLISNHSYGIETARVPDWYFGAYIKVSQDWDKIMYSAPYYLMVTAAGNAQNSRDNESPIYGKTQDGFDLLLGFTTAKNNLVVTGANTSIDRQGQLKDADVASYSSFGPTDDGRIKPDLAGDGTLIFSTSADSNSSYNSSMGTSMAAPGVTGSLLLLQEYHRELYGNFMKAATLKGLALHTADDVKEPGPDYKMGWGIINAKQAAEVLRNKEYTTVVNEETLTEDSTFSMTIKANGTSKLSASISWTDPVNEFVNRGDVNSSVRALANDLDIRITKDGKTYFPWKLNPAMANTAAQQGNNLVDPFERVDIADADGEYTITISHKGKLAMNRQDFTLIVTGTELTNCKLDAPKTLSIESTDEDGAFLIWEALKETLFELEYKKGQDTNWTYTTTWENAYALNNLEHGERYVARIRSVCSQNLVSEYSDEIEFIYNGKDTFIEAFQPLTMGDELNFSVYPNPVVDQLKIDTKLSKDAHFTVITTTGTTIKSGNMEEYIDVADLSTGLYVLTIQDYNGIKSAKFFKD